MTFRLDPELDAELRLAAEEDRRSIHETVVLAIETFLELRDTAEVLADPEALRTLAEARQEVADGDIAYGADGARSLALRRQVP